MKKKDYRNKEWLYQRYVKEGLTSCQLAGMQGCTPTAIRYWIKKHGIAMRRPCDYQQSGISEGILQDLYVDQHKTIMEVAQILSVSQNTVIKYLRKYGIRSRRVTDYPSFIEGHRRMRKKLEGCPRSWKTRVKISQAKTIGQWKGFSYKGSIFREHRNRPEYKEWRQGVFERDEFTCQECGKYSGYLELHHIIPSRDYEEGIMLDANAITLCKKCHNKTKRREYEFATRYSSIVAGLL